MTGYKNRNSIPFILGMFFLTSCGGLPHLKPTDTATHLKTVSACENAFPQGKWQFAHEISAILPEGREARLIGVTQLSSSGETVHAVMMTIEGLVLFDGLFDGKLTINRGVAPFDSQKFAQGLMDDIRLMFFKPAGNPMNAGLTEDGFRVCRYRVSGNAVVDVLIRSNSKVEIRKYRDEKLTRKVVSEAKPAPEANLVPEKIAFAAYAPAEYRLNLRLISAERIND